MKEIQEQRMEKGNNFNILNHYFKRNGDFICLRLC